MANYTIELKDIVACGYNIFDFPYDFYDEKKRKEFEEKFIRHFYFREIGAETIDRFKMYLRDKMDTVFPYYNEMFKTTLIEYSVLDNYNMTESTTTTRENTAKSAGVSHSVGQIFEEQEETTTENRNTNTEGTTSETVSDTSEKSRNGSSETTRNGSSETKAKETDKRDTETTNSETETTSKDDKKRFMDTPMGKVDLSDNKFLTTMNHDTLDGERNTNGEGTVSDSSEKNTESNTTTTDTENTTTTDTENGTTTREGNGSTTGKEDFEATAKGSMKGEQRNTADNNTRLESVGNAIETIEHKRRGNIGIDTDSDMIQKHLKLQKILRKIELMFFDECEDLFMLVY